MVADAQRSRAPIQANARDSISALRKQGLRVIMLTGDNPTTAQIVTDAVGGLDEVHRSNDFVDEPADILLLKPV